MRLNNVRLPNHGEHISILIKDEKILDDNCRHQPAITINLAGAIAFPGLVNSHDHLDFNCFSPLGDKIYNNYTEWGNHIHAAFPNEIKKVLTIPQVLRVQWGMYKNLLAG